MITLLITTVALVLLILIIIWGHYIRVNLAPATGEQLPPDQARDHTNVRLYHEHKAEIEQDYAQGAIDNESYHHLLTELDRGLLQDMTADKNNAATTTDKRLALAWPVLLTLFILAFSFTLYQQQGAYALLTAPSATTGTTADANPHQGLDSEQQALVQVKQLQQQLKTDPDNAELWYNLGQTSIGMGDFNGALKAFDEVIRLEGEHADLLGAKAQALYYRNNQQIDQTVQHMIDRALALDPQDPATNILLGMHSFTQQNYQRAVHYWQLVMTSGKSNINTQALAGAIEEAKNRLKLTDNDTTVTDSASTTMVAGPQLTLNISLSDELMQQLSQQEDKSVFIYATPANGQRMPLAAVKMHASDLPTTVVLNNSKAMSPQANLSTVDSVNVYAIVSNLGSVGIKTGDMKAERLNVAVSTTAAIELVIDTLVP